MASKVAIYNFNNFFDHRSRYIDTIVTGRPIDVVNQIVKYIYRRFV